MIDEDMAHAVSYGKALERSKAASTQRDVQKIPREPTEAMLVAGTLAWSKEMLIGAIWQAMYDTASQEQSK